MFAREAFTRPSSYEYGRAVSVRAQGHAGGVQGRPRLPKGWLIPRESGTFVRFTGAPAASPGRIGHDLCCPQRKARRDDRRADIRKEASVIERYNLIVIERGKILYRSRVSRSATFSTEEPYIAALIGITYLVLGRLARRFVEDMRAFHAKQNVIMADEIAARQLHALREYSSPHDRKLHLSDVKEMFEQMRDHA
jgi:hypothetical protein